MPRRTLGKLLLHLGPERILWGTDSIWYGSPQGQIDALRAFTISEPFQEQFGYPASRGVEGLILGGNAARLYNAPTREHRSDNWRWGRLCVAPIANLE